MGKSLERMVSMDPETYRKTILKQENDEGSEKKEAEELPRESYFYVQV